MAGYLITLNDERLLEECMRTGSYSTILHSPRYGSWGVNHEGTFADSINKGFRPTKFCTWNLVKLVKYDAIENDLEFEIVDA